MSLETKNKNSPKAGERTVLGFDYGTKRIGVAIGQELTSQASGVTTVNALKQKPNWQEIDQIIEKWSPDVMVVGIPVHMDGTEHEMTEKAKKFCRQLQHRYNLQVFEVDERLSSVEAESQLAEQGKTSKAKKSKRYRFSKAEIDQLAAQIIVQTWLNQN